jgi:hypothetical protein
MVPRIAFLCLLAAGAAHAQRLAPVEIADAVVVETIAIPSPSEFLIAVDKQCEPNWSKVAPTPPPANTADREQLAAQLGMIYTDCHVAIEAGDAQSVRNSVRDLLAIADKLNIGADPVARLGSIDDLAGNGEWNALRGELDALRNDMRLALLAQRDDSLLVIASVGSFNRQIEVASAVVAENWSPERARVLEVSPIAAHLVERLDGLPVKARSAPFVQKLTEGLSSLHGLMQSWRSGRPEKKSLLEITAITEDLSRAAREEPSKGT